MKFEVMGDRILVKRAEPVAASDTGIFVPQSVEKGFVQAEVVEKGAEVKGYHLGDKVMLTKMSGFSFKYEGTDYIMVRADEVLAKLKD